MSAEAPVSVVRSLKSAASCPLILSRLIRNATSQPGIIKRPLRLSCVFLLLPSERSKGERPTRKIQARLSLARYRIDAEIEALA